MSTLNHMKLYLWTVQSTPSILTMQTWTYSYSLVLVFLTFRTPDAPTQSPSKGKSLPRVLRCAAPSHPGHRSSLVHGTWHDLHPPRIASNHCLVCLLCLVLPVLMQEQTATNSPMAGLMPIDCSKRVYELQVLLNLLERCSCNIATLLHHTITA